MSEPKKEAADGGGVSAASASQPQNPPSDPVQKEGLTVHDGGVPIGHVRSLAEVDGFRQICRAHGLSSATFIAAWREQSVDGYPRRTDGIRIRNGEIEVQGDVPMPDDATAKRLLEAHAAANFPKLQTLRHIDAGPPGVDLGSKDVFICHNVAGDIVMVHERYHTKDGGKGFIPWTFWEDREWRKMEPEVMPFFGLPGHGDAATLFLHEGSKAARRVKDIIAGEIAADKFPWFDAMQYGHHVGWIGGVHAIGRSDWAGLAALGWSRIVIIADNDKKGMKAAQRIARRFSRNVFILMFDQQFADGHDCGDDWPPSLFDERGCHTGPTMEDCLVPATKATFVVPAEGRGRPTVLLRDEYAETIAYTVDPPRFMHRHRPSRDLSADEFNSMVAPFSDVKDTATKVLGHIECQHDRLVYHPGFAAGTLQLDGARCFNVYEGPRLRPAKGDVAPWLEYLEHLIPDAEERAMVVRWLVTLIAKPGVRMRYGLLLISTTQGVGKNTLANVLKLLLGSANVSFPSENSVVESAFNGWAARKRLIFIAEIYSGHSRKAYDKLKSVLADDDLEVNEKHVKQYWLANWATVIACSNSEAALHLDDEDRRWLVPTVAETLKPSEWWLAFYAWVNGEGASFIFQWALDHASTGDFVRTGDHAPWSKRKRAIADASRSEGQQLAISFAEHLAGLDRRVIVRISDVRRWIAFNRGFRRGDEADVSDRRLEKPSTIIAAMKKVQGVTIWADGLRPKFGATREAVVMNFRPAEGEAWTDIKGHLTDLEGVKLDAPM